jgi:hypothetical protein
VTNYNRNPTGKGGFKPGESGNPAGRARKHIGDLSAEARKYAALALSSRMLITFFQSIAKK